MTNSSNNSETKSNTSEMQDFENNSIALYNQQIIQILCSDTLELEIELARDLVNRFQYIHNYLLKKILASIII
jgi:hypothetical protein